MAKEFLNLALPVLSGETRQPGYLYYVKGENLEVWKTKMARGGKHKKDKDGKGGG